MINLEKYTTNSVFDKYHKLEDPSGHFAWEPLSPSFWLRKDEVICEGELQEIDVKTSFLHSTRYYAATPRGLVVCSVFFI